MDELHELNECGEDQQHHYQSNSGTLLCGSSFSFFFLLEELFLTDLLI
jgi:hypothetical protein